MLLLVLLTACLLYDWKHYDRYRYEYYLYLHRHQDGLQDNAATAAG